MDTLEVINLYLRAPVLYSKIIASFTFLEVVGDIIIKGTLELDLQRVIIFFIGLSTYLKEKGLLTST